jgi:hypothetical protein
MKSESDFDDDDDGHSASDGDEKLYDLRGL